MSEVRTKLFEMVAAAEPKQRGHWRMTPIAFTKIRLAEDRSGDLISTDVGHRPTCLGIPVEIVPPSVYRASEIALGDGKMVTL